MDEFDKINTSGENDTSNNEYHYVPPVEQKPVQNVQPPKSSYYQQNANRQYYQPVNQPNQSGYYVPNGSFQPAPNMPMPPKKKKKKSPIVIIIIAILAVAICGYGIVSAVTNSKISGGLSISDNDKNDKAENSKNDEDGSASLEAGGAVAKTDADGNLTVAGVVEKTIDSCVMITVYMEQSPYSYFYGFGYDNQSSGDEIEAGQGSGVIMSEANGKTYIMTAAHVISSGSSFKVTTNDNKKYDATVVGYDAQTDIGVISIDATGLKIASFGNSKDIVVGEQVVVIGCPYSKTFMNSVATGIVSAVDRPLASSIGYDNECIQTDAAINPGNSGGALFNMAGQVIGINSSKIASTDYEGMGFSVPSNTAVKTANSLIKNGYVAGRAKLGITYNEITNVSNANAILNALDKKGFENCKGAMIINEVSSDSDLANKDIKQYDMIVAVNGNTMTSVDVLTKVLSKSSPGDSITLTIARIENNQIKTFDVKCKLIEAKN